MVLVKVKFDWVFSINMQMVTLCSKATFVSSLSFHKWLIEVLINCPLLATACYRSLLTLCLCLLPRLYTGANHLKEAV